jgi:D-amino-acid dehydrogenase
MRIRGIIAAATTYYPEITAADFAGIAPWRGLRPCSPDGMPYIGRTSRYANLSIGSGHAMMGMSLGPVTGQLIAEVLSGEAPRIDLTLVSPDRYATR